MSPREVAGRPGSRLHHTVAELYAAKLPRREQRAEIRGVLPVLVVLRIERGGSDQPVVGTKGRPCTRRPLGFAEPPLLAGAHPTNPAPAAATPATPTPARNCRLDNAMFRPSSMETPSPFSAALRRPAPRMLARRIPISPHTQLVKTAFWQRIGTKSPRPPWFDMRYWEHFKGFVGSARRDARCRSPSRAACARQPGCRP